mmetsp:Transcript_15715/g.24989  ORF Transcript_15715/g.24989 Transcript_15715/m.24989 type:complete len:188 (+) Transcript_15715:46-609(+)
MDARDASDVVKSQLWKTTMCRFHVLDRCTKGASCPFAHDPSELRIVPDLNKTSLCQDWQNGKCSQGKKCRFAHGVKELKITPQFMKRPKPPVVQSKASLETCRETSGDWSLVANTPVVADRLLDASLATGSVALIASSTVRHLLTKKGGEYISLEQMVSTLLQTAHMAEDRMLENMLTEAQPDTYED